MRKIINNILGATCLGLVVACSPVNENLTNSSQVEVNPDYAQGVLLNGYQGLINQYEMSAVATDDAVHNQIDNGLRKMATGQLTSRSNPLNRWGKYKYVFYLNKFLSIVDNVQWQTDEEANELYVRRMKGEALALRGLMHMYILQAHAGYDESGQLMGVPFYSEFVPSNGDFNQPRLTFEATVDSIEHDFNRAYELLPYIYSDNPDDIPAKDSKYDVATYLMVNNSSSQLRMQGQIVRGFQSRLHLLAASPAFLDSEDEYKLAIQYADEILDKINYQLPADGVEYYNEDNDKDSPEIIWRGNTVQENWLENQNYPYSLNGQGNVNPSQNLVDAFYKSDGYPIASTQGVAYDSSNPYANRDPRLNKYVLFDGGEIGGHVINISSQSDDGVNKIPNRSTRTGYYLKKHLRPEVVIPTNGTPTQAQHFSVYLRCTELFLNIAEAENELGGPDYTLPGVSLSAKEIIRAIRKRGLQITEDPYLDGLNTKSAMREEIRNERRLELCFEGFRFWDVRRYKMNLVAPVMGVNKDMAAYNMMTVEDRMFEGDKYFYMPLPYGETLKYDGLTQNKGW